MRQRHQSNQERCAAGALGVASKGREEPLAGYNRDGSRSGEAQGGQYVDSSF